MSGVIVSCHCALCVCVCVNCEKPNGDASGVVSRGCGRDAVCGVMIPPLWCKMSFKKFEPHLDGGGNIMSAVWEKSFRLLIWGPAHTEDHWASEQIEVWSPDWVHAAGVRRFIWTDIGLSLKITGQDGTSLSSLWGHLWQEGQYLQNEISHWCISLNTTISIKQSCLGMTFCSGDIYTVKINNW